MCYYLILLIALFVIELLYFKLADHFNIIDKPNHRSSHTKVTIRGGGIIFAKAIVIWFLFNGFEYFYFIIGLILISTISFLDDIITLNNKMRLSVHLISVLLLFLQWNLFQLQWYWLLITLMFVIATINAYNFMDGINGITGGYSLLTIATLYYINENVVAFVSPQLLIVVMLSLVVFNFFNFRTNAKCFAGDVGSVSMAFIIIFLMGQLIMKTNNLNYILLLLVYGMDTAFTVFFRKLRGENIFEAHRSHFYQYLTNHLKYSHLWVAGSYIAVQLLINVLVVLLIVKEVQSVYIVLLFLSFILAYLGLRLRIEGKLRLFVDYRKND